MNTKIRKTYSLSVGRDGSQKKKETTLGVHYTEGKGRVTKRGEIKIKVFVLSGKVLRRSNTNREGYMTDV